MTGWMEGTKSHFKDCLQQPKSTMSSLVFYGRAFRALALDPLPPLNEWDIFYENHSIILVRVFLRVTA